MRILCVVDRLSTRGGSERYLEDLVRALPGIEWHVAYGHADATAPRAREGVRSATRVPALAERSSREPGSIAELIGAIRPDRVLVQNVMAPGPLTRLATVPGVIAIAQDHRTFCPARGKVFPDGVPCAEPVGPACDRCFPGDVALRDERMALVALRRDALRRFSRVVVLSSYMSRELLAAGIDEARIACIPPAAPCWTPVDAPGDRVAVVGRMSWHKGSLHILRALAAARVATPVTFVGSGPDGTAVRDEATRCGLDVEITGWLGDAAMRERLARARVVAMPSLWAEPFGIAGIEAAALGLPVVAHAVGAIPEWLDHERTGLLAPPADGAALAAAIRRLLDDGALAARLGRTASERVQARFPRAAFGGSWAELLSIPVS